MWEGKNIKEQMEFAHKDIRYLIAETLYRKQIVENIMEKQYGNLDTLTMDILVFMEITNMLSKKTDELK